MGINETQFAIETLSLTKIFTDWWGRSKVVAVDELNLRIRRNEVFGLLGPNGSGKTTTLKMLLSLLHPTKGRAIVLGGDSRDSKISSRIGFMPEESYLYPYLNARETLEFYGTIFSLPRKVRKMRADALLDMVGLSAMASRPVGTFSKGMARRIGLAQALINDPDLVILDEPTSGLDPIGTRQIKDLIIELAKRGKTILLCSHLLADVEDVCDRIAILYGGKMQRQGRVAELLSRDDKSQIVTSKLTDTAMASIKQIIESEQGQYEISSPQEKLESFFIDIVNEARRAKVPTSGAQVETTVGGEVTTSSILDKLVAASVSDKRIEPESTGPEPVEPTKAGADKEFLDTLTTSAEPVETEPVKETNKTVETTVPESDRKTEIKKGVLEQLLDDSGADSQPDQADNAQPGEKGDA